MKTILVPTDFSVTAQMAAQYAAALAQAIQAQLTLVHTYHLPVEAEEIPGKSSPSSGHEGKHQKQMEIFLRELKEYTIPVKSFVVPGLAAEEIPNMAEALEADLIVMGTKPSRGLSRNLFGSITTAVISRSSVPVLVVPEGVVFKQPKTIVFASDFGKTPEPGSFQLLREVSNHFQATIQVLHVHHTELKEVADQYDFKLENALVAIKHSYELVTDEDAVHGIEQFLAETRPDWLVMIPYKYSLLDRIFHRSCTRYMALHASLPLLVLPGGR